MTSNINPNDIDGAYPVAGQDNNSQGFRDNFTNTKTNFQYAADEITALQNKAVLTAQLSGNGNVINNMQTSVISNGKLQNMSNVLVPLGTTSGTVTLNYALGSYFTLTTNGTVTLGFSNLPVAGNQATWTLNVYVASTAHTIQLPVNSGPAPIVNATGIQGFNPSTSVITFAAIGAYSFTFVTSDGGSTVSIVEVNKELEPFNASTETISANANVSLATASSVITSSANLVLILNSGVIGQSKVLAYGNSSTGNTLITVVNAGWKSTGNGTANLSTTGSAVTLQYINSKWYAIGNNGATFS